MNIDIQKLTRENIRKLKPYSSARDDFQGNASVFLDANENPFPSPFNRYPDPHQQILRKAIAELKKVNTNQVFLGNGSDEVIDLLFRAFCEPEQDEVIIPQPTYGMYTVSAGINNIAVSSPRLNDQFNLDGNTVLRLVTQKTKLIFLCSPNNPSGNLLDSEEILKILKGFNGLVVIDEAYIDFTNSLSWSTRLTEFKNLVVMQTFSKAWGLAGLRLGMCFADVEILHVLEKIKPPYNIGTFAQEAALKAIREGKKQMEKWVTDICDERERLRTELLKIKKVKKIYPTDANFLLVQLPQATQVYKELVTRSIIVRDRSNVVLCEDCLRITVGTRAENDQLLKALKDL